MTADAKDGFEIKIRTQLVVIGGDIPMGEGFLESFRETVRESCFGGARGDLPEIKAAALGKEAGVIRAASLI